MTKIHVPLTVPKNKEKEYIKNYKLATRNTDRMMMFAGDQKVEHLNNDFVGKGIAKEVADPEHYFKIASKANIGVFASQLGLIAKYGRDYPDIPYLVKVNSKTNLIKKQQQQTSIDDYKYDTLSNQNHSLNRAIADSLRRTLPRAPAVKDTGEFVWPDSLLKARYNRKVTLIFKIKIDFFGNIEEYELLSPSGLREVDSLAVIALTNTIFDMDDFDDMSLIEDYFRYDMILKPPDLFYYDTDPYRNR